MDKQKKYFIIDFDSTFVKSEGLDEFAQIILKKNPEKDSLLKKIKKITNLGMNGEISYEQSLRQRLKLLAGNKLHIKQVVKILQKKISKSIKSNIKFFKLYQKNIFIVSGGFKEFILPIVKPFGINKNHVFANTFNLDKYGKITGFDQDNPLSKSGGKAKIISDLNLKGMIIVIGDGYTDYEIKASGVANHFVAFTENIYRSIVVEKADEVVSSFDEFLYRSKAELAKV